MTGSSWGSGPFRQLQGALGRRRCTVHSDDSDSSLAKPPGRAASVFSGFSILNVDAYGSGEPQIVAGPAVSIMSAAANEQVGSDCPPIEISVMCRSWAVVQVAGIWQ